MPSVNCRLERLEHDACVGSEAGPSLIVLTALGRDEEEVRAIKLSSGLKLIRHDGESPADFRNRASAWAAGFGSSPAKLAAAIYDIEDDTEVHR
ncbi:hypothetical protein [Roseateles sp. P5_E4]